jgi:hypothetical protein
VPRLFGGQIFPTSHSYRGWQTIRGHVFCSFLALAIRKQLHDRIERKGWKLEWADVVNDVDALEEITLNHLGNEFTLRTESIGVAGKVFQAAGVALPQVLKQTNFMSTTPEPYP